VLVRTGGRYGSSSGSRSKGDGSSARSWLLIKHRDEWSGDLDIAEFAPRSVKSNGDFEDILAQDTPAVWLSNKPARGGEAGALLGQIIERAAKLRSTKLAAKAGLSAPSSQKARHAKSTSREAGKVDKAKQPARVRRKKK
jgi:hypothetical protein